MCKYIDLPLQISKIKKECLLSSNYQERSHTFIQCQAIHTSIGHLLPTHFLVFRHSDYNYFGIINHTIFNTVIQLSIQIYFY